MDDDGYFIEAERRLILVTGIHVTSENSRNAESEYTLVPTPWTVDHLEEKPLKSEATFVLYDAGWHREDIDS